MKTALSFFSIFFWPALLYSQENSILLSNKVIPKSEYNRQIASPKVKWLVDRDAGLYCSQVKVKDGYVDFEDGCAYWLIKERQCTLVTTSQTSHAFLGKLFMHCLDG